MNPLEAPALWLAAGQSFGATSLNGDKYTTFFRGFPVLMAKKTTPCPGVPP